MVDLKAKRDEIKNIENVKAWLEGKSDDIQLNYLNGLAEFCIVNKIGPDRMIRTIENEKQLPLRQLSTNKWFNNYIKYGIKFEKSPKTIENRVTIVKGFIKHHDLDFYYKLDDSIKIPEQEAKDFLYRKDIKKLLDASKSLKIKAIILIQVSSGLAVSNIIKLQIKDFNKGIFELKDKNNKLRRVCKLSLKKKDREYITFLSEEAVKAIESYLAIERENLKPNEPLFSRSNNPIKQMSSQSLQESYRNLNDRLGWYNKKGKSRKATSRSVQKFFDTQMINAGMNDATRKYLTGYHVDYPIDEEQLIKNYLEHIDSVTIGPIKSPVSLSEYEFIKKRNDELCDDVNVLLDEQEEKEPDSELEIAYNQMSEGYSHMMALNRAIEIRMDAMEKRYKKLEKELELLKRK